MKAFRFPLDRVLHWRTTQCELEEAAAARLTSQRQQLASTLDQIGRQRQEAAESILEQREIDSAAFQTLAHFHKRIAEEKIRVQQKSKALEIEIAAQLLRTADARRKKRLLETLRNTKFKSWTAQHNAENEQSAADAWLTRYAAERYTTTNASPEC